MAQFANTPQQVVQRIQAIDGIGRVQHRTFTGVRVSDILALHGVNVNNLPANATMVITTYNAAETATSDTPATHAIANPANFLAATTILAWHEVDHGEDDGTQNTVVGYLTRPRLIFGDAAGVLWGQHSQRVVTITLTF